MPKIKTHSGAKKRFKLSLVIKGCNAELYTGLTDVPCSYVYVLYLFYIV